MNNAEIQKSDALAKLIAPMHPLDLAGMPQVFRVKQLGYLPNISRNWRISGAGGHDRIPGLRRRLHPRRCPQAAPPGDHIKDQSTFQTASANLGGPIL